ncbi:MAG: glycosyltransferase family 1 protein [Patescibacteria group bacterium]|nr:MAG: glycosyltransferase family 1 protein [Patescibacteria group bacterium]
MKIGIDAQTLIKRSAGVTYYTQGLLEEIFKQDKKNRYDLMFFGRKPEHMLGKGSSFTYKYQRFFPYKFFRYATYAGLGVPLLPLEAFFGRHDIYFFPDFVEYPHWTGKSVVVIHDLSFLKVPQYVAKFNEIFLRRFVSVSAKRADHLIANSEYTKQDIVNTYKISEDRVTVAYPGVDRKKFKPASKPQIEKVKEKYGLEKPFILYLGTLEPRKNIVSILKAYANLESRGDFNLVLAGKKGWMYNEIFRQVEDLGIEEDVIFTGFVPDEDKPVLLSAAEVFVYPSFFEGFGMPVVEAQACGTPVVTSNTTSLPEAAGGAALLVDPHQVDGLKGAVERLLSAAELRENLSAKGLENAKRFRWDESAGKVLNVFNSLL